MKGIRERPGPVASWRGRDWPMSQIRGQKEAPSGLWVVENQSGAHWSRRRWTLPNGKATANQSRALRSNVGPRCCDCILFFVRLSSTHLKQNPRASLRLSRKTNGSRVELRAGTDTHTHTHTLGQGQVERRRIGRTRRPVIVGKRTAFRDAPSFAYEIAPSSITSCL